MIAWLGRFCAALRVQKLMMATSSTVAVLIAATLAMPGSSVFAAPAPARAPALASPCGTAAREALIVPFINDAPESSRQQQTHRYGARYIEIRRNAISLDHTLLDPYHENIFIVGRLPAAHFTTTQNLDLTLTAKLIAPPAGLQFILGVEFADGFVFAAANGTWKFERQAFVKKERVAKSQILPRELKLFDFGQMAILTTKGCNRYAIPGLSALIAKHGAPRQWFFIAPNSAKKPIKIEFLGLTASRPTASGLTAGDRATKANGPPAKLIWGEVRFAFTPRPAVVKILYENNEQRIVHLSTDRKFSFLDEYPDQAMSVRLVYGHEFAYPDRGRWFGRHRPRGPLVINVRNPFANLTASRVDSKRVIKKSRRSRLYKNPIGYNGHTVRLWAGGYDSIQEFENWHFANYNGFQDRDWDPQNRSKCLRVAHIGQSIVQAIQVTLSEKHSILASERLSVTMGKCVEVASFSAGFTPSTESAIDWVVAQFKPDVLLFSAHRQMMQITTPELATATFEMTRGHASLDTFELQHGKLVLIPKDPKFHLAKKVKRRYKAEGIAIAWTFNLPFDVMPKIALDAFETLEALMARYHKKYGNMPVAIEYSHTPAECHKAVYCRRRQRVRGTRYKSGAIGFIRNMEALCARSVAHCVSSKIPPDSFRTYPGVVYQHDTHLTPKGNAWQAGILARGLEPILRNLARSTATRADSGQ